MRDVSSVMYGEMIVDDNGGFTTGPCELEISGGVRDNVAVFFA